MGARRYGISLRVLNLISHEWAQPTSEISSWTREENIHVYKQPCIILYHQKVIHTNDDLFDDFPKMSEHFPKILLRLSEGQTIVSEQFLKVTEHFRGRADDVFIIQEHIQVLFKGLYNHSNCDLFTSENNVLFSRVKILRLRAKDHLAFHWYLYNKLISENEKIGFWHRF